MKKVVSVWTVWFIVLVCLPVFGAAASEFSLLYGENQLSTEVLTNFTDGEVCGTASGNGSMIVENGALSMACKSGSYVESYSFYKGGNIASAAVANAKYIGFRVENCSDADIAFAFQGQRQGGANFRMARDGEDMLIG